MEGSDSSSSSDFFQVNPEDSFFTCTLKHITKLLVYSGITFVICYLSDRNSPPESFGDEYSSDDDDDWDLDTDWNVEAGRERG